MHGVEWEGRQSHLLMRWLVVCFGVALIAVSVCALAAAAFTVR